MKQACLRAISGLVVTLLMTQASALEIRSGKTEVKLVSADERAAVISVEFRAGLTGVVGLTRENVIVTWENAGGVSPNPFKILIPAGCFVLSRDVYRIANFETCGVEISRQSSGVITRYSIADFSGRVIVDATGNGLLELNALFGTTPDDGAPVLGATGGAVIEIAVGRESAFSLPKSVESFSGVSPQPF